MKKLFDSFYQNQDFSVDDPKVDGSGARKARPMDDIASDIEEELDEMDKEEEESQSNFEDD